MDVYERSERIAADANRQLADAGDQARIRYMSVEPDPVADQGWLVLMFWELPFPDDDIWPADQLRLYRKIVREKFEGVANTMCVFRDPDEMQDEELRTGWAVRELA